jgi:membrane fusion protein (multidrug efflux system)
MASSAPRKQLRLPYLLIAGLAMLLGLIALYNYFLLPKVILPKVMAENVPPPAIVSAELARSEFLGTPLQAIGSLEAVNSTSISSEVGGTVQDIRFQSGQTVRTGDVLVVLSRGSETADKSLAEATLRTAQRDLDRAQQLLKDGWLTKATYDQRLAARDQARAQVARANSETSKRVVRAPFSGRLGIRSVNLGDYVAPGQALVSLQTVDPIYATAAVPEQALGQLRVGLPVSIAVDSLPGRTFNGRISSRESGVDPATRTIRVQATLPNDDGVLTPGMYAKFLVTVPNQRQVLTVPETAVAFSLSGSTLYVLERDRKGDGVFTARQRIVTTGNTTDGRVEITSGISAGDLIVTNGQMKLFDGAQASVIAAQAKTK